MLTATDSFIEYLAANLTFPVYWWRQTAIDEHGGFLKVDSLNVRFLGFYEQGSIEYCHVSLDLLGSDERVVVGQLKAMRDLLIDLQTIPEYDYIVTNPVPQATGRNISWDGRAIQFLSVRTPAGARYVHYNASFPLVYTRE